MENEAEQREICILILDTEFIIIQKNMLLKMKVGVWDYITQSKARNYTVKAISADKKLHYFPSPVEIFPD